MPDVYDKERTLGHEISEQVEQALPGVEVLAVELTGQYLRQYSVDVSSPGLERPLRKPQHFRRFVGRRVALRTERELDGRKKFRGTVVAADGEALALAVGDGERMDIPYEQIVRGNLIDERER